MEPDIDDLFFGTPHSSMFYNYGAPRSREWSEPVSESYLYDVNSSESRWYTIKLPEENGDIESWLLKIAAKAGWNGWDEINSHIVLPREKRIVFTESKNYSARGTGDAKKLVRTAILLSMCNQFCYLPDGPRIFTRSRLERKIKLVKIKLDNFYDLE